MYVQRIRDLRSLGIDRWENSMEVGTTTEKCIHNSRVSLSFLGIAATKWTRDEKILSNMLRRHAAHGGRARFLLLDPDSEECNKFSKITQRDNKSLRDTIKESANCLIQLRDKHKLPIEIKYYSSQPIFRITIVDENSIIVGLYSHNALTGEDAPQLFLKQSSSEWSYYFAFNALFTAMWQNAIDP